MTDPAREITQLIAEWQQGDRGAESELFEALYRALHDIAVMSLRSDRQADSLGPTGLVHEAYLRLSKSKDLHIVDRAHFLSLCARVMKRIVVDKARKRKTVKRGSDGQRVELEDPMLPTEQHADEIILVDTALGELAEVYPRQAQLVEVRYFTGLSLDEASLALGISSRTAKRDWELARLWLKTRLNGRKTSDRSKSDR
jgi:RNA polymerase sigma-70 factor (ECF subfamily)